MSISVSVFRSSLMAAVFLLVLVVSGADAAEHRVETLDKAPASDSLSKAIASQLADTGFKVVRGTSRTVCEFWPCKEWTAIAGFEPTLERLYPFTPGQLIGVLHYRRRGKDFRDQTVSSGWYTLRYALQPTDGNHVGTSPTVDFLVLVSAEKDQGVDAWEEEELMAASAEAAGSSHPAMLCLQTVKGAKSAAAMRHVEHTDWWVLEFTGKAVADGSASSLPLGVVVAGHAEE